MDINEIKNLIEIDGGKFIIVENGKPIMVVVGFDDYKNKIIENKTNQPAAKKEQKPLYADPLRRSFSEASKQEMPKELESEPLKLEDLPL